MLRKETSKKIQKTSNASRNEWGEKDRNVQIEPGK